jgi:hypothetical protein
MVFNIFFSILAGLIMDVPVQAVLFLGIIPALFIMWISLKGYEGYYKDKSIFLTFVIGIIFGVIAVVVRLVISPLPLLIVFIILFAFFEQLFKTIVLNLRRLHIKKEATIYGLSLGLGFGSSFTPFMIIAESMSGYSSNYFLILAAIGSLGIILFHSATSAYIGFGIYSGKLTRYLLIAILIQLPFNAIIDATRILSLRTYFPHIQAGLVIYGLIVFIYVIKRIMPQILEQKKGRKRSKK